MDGNTVSSRSRTSNCKEPRLPLEWAVCDLSTRDPVSLGHTHSQRLRLCAFEISHAFSLFMSISCFASPSPSSAFLCLCLEDPSCLITQRASTHLQSLVLFFF